MTNVIHTGIGQIPFPEPTMIPVNGVELEVFEAGIENAGNPIVLCHGFPELAYSWRHQISVLAEAGYHVIAPNQRGYGNSTSPEEVEAYDIKHLTGDLVALLDHFGYKNASFIGHDWGANVIWHLALLHPERVSKVINLALPYQDRGEKPWLEFMEEVFGEDFYFVHFNKYPGVADAVLDANTTRFLSNLFRKNKVPAPPEPGNAMMNLALSENPEGENILNDEELSVFISAFEKSGFKGSINWYRNMDRNWHFMADVEPKIKQPTLMIYGEQDMIPPSPTLKKFAPKLDVHSIDCGHWIQQEKPEQTNEVILDWLDKQKT